MADEAFNSDSGGFAVKWTLKASAEEPKVRAGEVARVAGLQTDENEPEVLEGMTIKFMRIFRYLQLFANSVSKYASSSDGNEDPQACTVPAPAAKTQSGRRCLNSRFLPCFC